MLSFLAAGHPPKRTVTASQKRVLYEGGRSSQEFHTPEESVHFVTHAFYPDTKMFNPPLHMHTFQKEYFRVRKGVAHYYISNTGAWLPDTSKPIIAKAGDVAVVPVRAYHRFINASTEGEELVVDIELDPDTRRLEFRFFRNFFGYLDDCAKHGMQPSLFQLLLMLWHISGPMAIPIPLVPNFVGVMVSQAFCFLFGVVIGQWVLGYQVTYPEYYKEEVD